MNHNQSPVLSVVIPCRNEVQFIGRCLDSIVENDFPHHKMEVLVVDGLSEDGTREIVARYAGDHPCIKLLSNPDKTTPKALNIGIEFSRGEYVLILSSHSMVAPSFFRKNIESFQKYSADCIGGPMVTLPAAEKPVPIAIAIALAHLFGVGNAYFRTGVKIPRYVDTVPFGCYKRDVFRQIGLFNEHLIRNQDIEFNLRLRKSGGKILLNPQIKSYYHARANLKSLFKQNFGNGCWVFYSMMFAKLPFSIRHLIPAIFVLSLILPCLAAMVHFPMMHLSVLSLSLYGIATVFFSMQISLKRSLIYIPYTGLTFATLHFSYGLGSLWGMFRLILARMPSFYK